MTTTTDSQTSPSHDAMSDIHPRATEPQSPTRRTSRRIHFERPDHATGELSGPSHEIPFGERLQRAFDGR